jgi:hypothetical protein
MNTFSAKHMIDCAKKEGLFEVIIDGVVKTTYMCKNNQIIIGAREALSGVRPVDIRMLFVHLDEWTSHLESTGTVSIIHTSDFSIKEKKDARTHDLDITIGNEKVVDMQFNFATKLMELKRRGAITTSYANFKLLILRSVEFIEDSISYHS